MTSSEEITVNPRARTNRTIIAECLLWFLAFLLTAGFCAWKFAPSYTNDSYQYLSEAGNIIHGEGLQTSIIFYDVERRHARVPAPLTTFPPGYALVISLFGKLGIDLVSASVAISLLSCGAAFLIVMALGAELNLDWIAIRVALAMVLFNSAYLQYSIAVMSEGLFTAALCAAIFFYVRSILRDQPKSADWWIAGMFLATIVWIRYAGMFIVAGVGLYMAMAYVIRLRRFWPALLSLVLPVGSTAALLIHNVQAASDWRGGSGAAVRVTPHPLIDFLKNLVPLIYHSLFGNNVAVHFGVVEIGFGLAAALLAALALTAAVRGETPRFGPKGRALVFLGIVLVIYTALLVYNVLTTAIFYSSRYYMPLLPVFAVAIGIVLDWLLRATERARNLRRAAVAAVIVLGLGYADLNLKDLNAFQPNYTYDGIAKIMNEPTRQGDSLRRWIDLHVAPDAVVFASSGQATGFEWGRKTVSLAEAPFSSQPWTEQNVHSLMLQYHASYLVVYRDITAARLDAEEISQSPFLGNLSADRNPAWLEEAVAAPHALVFHLKNP